MELDRARIVDQNFKTRVLAKNFPVPRSKTLPQDAGLDKTTFLELFDSQLISRHLDLLARELKEQQLGFYTIGSSGHEGNAAIAKALRKNDIAFLHYRSGAFMAQRSKSFPEIDIIYDQVLSLVASSDDPISGGRHKVFGSHPLCVPPQTSTIASHLPKALGAAFSMTHAKTLKIPFFTKLAQEGVVLCSFGDASTNHSTAQGAFNASQWVVAAQIPLPIIWLCEDNGFGISVATPPDWIEKSFKNRLGIVYIACDGLNLSDVYVAALKAQHLARKKGQPVFLHMKTVRLLGHAGSDIEFQYRKLNEIESTESDDPLLHSASTIISHGWLSSEEILKLYEIMRDKVHQAATRAIQTPKLMSAQAIMSSIIPPKLEIAIPEVPRDEKRRMIWSKQFQQLSQPRTMAQSLNYAITDILLQYPNIMIFGEDVGKKGGVYHITADLQSRFGPGRVFDTLLDEQTILGTAIGLAHNGFLPIPEIQFLAYTHNAVDQIRGEAATLSFFSKGQYTNPMVIRIPGLAYQKGFGGHFHNDNAIGFLREIPGIIIACPSKADEAALLFRQCVQLAYQYQRVVIFLEPIALYMVKDLYNPGDNLALSHYPTPDQVLPFGELGIEGESSDFAIISYGNGMYLSRQAAYTLKQKYDYSTKLIDIRWLAPISFDALAKALKGISKILIVDECRKTGSLSEAIVTWMVENLQPLPTIQRLTAEDSFIPLGKAWEFILPSCNTIIEKVLAMNKKT